MIGNQLHTLSYLKRVTGTRAQDYKCDHVLALSPQDATNLRMRLSGETWPNDMRSWRPRDGWAISRVDQAWLDIPTGYVIVHRAEAHDG